MTKKEARAYLNPTLAITFPIVAVTGLMMLFHIGGRWIHPLHDWMSIIFLILGIVHITLNWKPISACLTSRSATLPFAFVFLLSIALLIYGGVNGGPFTHGKGLGHGGQRIFRGVGR